MSKSNAFVISSQSKKVGLRPTVQTGMGKFRERNDWFVFVNSLHSGHTSVLTAIRRLSELQDGSRVWASALDHDFPRETGESSEPKPRERGARGGRAKPCPPSLHPSCTQSSRLKPTPTQMHHTLFYTQHWGLSAFVPMPFIYFYFSSFHLGGIKALSRPSLEGRRQLN